LKKLSHILFTLLFAITFVSYAICAIFVKPTVSVNTNETGIKLPIIMYHLVYDDENKINSFTVTPKMFEEDINYILQNGYTPINFDDLKRYVYSGESLPQKPIMITFDDGFYNNYQYVFPIIKEKNIKIVLSVVGSYSQKYSEIDDTNLYYSYCNWDILKTMHDSGLVEIQNHTYNLHTYDDNRKGVLKTIKETNEEYKKLIYDDFVLNHKMIEEKTGRVCEVLTFPYGLISNSSHDVVKDIGYLGSFSCVEGINNITKDPKCLYRMKRYNRKGSYTTKEFFENIIKF